MLLAAIFIFLFVILSLVVSVMTVEPMERIKKDQPEYYDSFGMSLIPFSPSRIAFSLFLLLGEYKDNVKCQSTVGQLEKVRPFVAMQLFSFVMFFVMVFINWNS